MGQVSTIYGVIHGYSRQHGGLDPDALNLAALASLPESDTWPFLVRSMFAMTESGQVCVDYKSRLIHFAASLKEVEGEWGEWIEKFERFLGKIDGTSVSLHLETEWYGNMFFEWERSKDTMDAWPPVWKFCGGPRSYEEIAERERPK